MLAVIQTGGKQYVVKKGDKIRVEKIAKKEGSKVTFDVLLKGDSKSLSLGTPKVAGAKVEATILEHDKDKKVTVIKHKKRKRYLKRAGHRQHKTLCEITKI